LNVWLRFAPHAVVFGAIRSNVEIQSGINEKIVAGWSVLSVVAPKAMHGVIGAIRSMRARRSCRSGCRPVEGGKSPDADRGEGQLGRRDLSHHGLDR